MSEGGSYQKGMRFRSENPLEELWSHIALLATEEHLQAHSRPEETTEDWNAFIRYAVVRIRQAIEFRNAAGNSSLLTKPLLLYYASLNLLRAALALRAEVKPKPAHGLHFHRKSHILKCYATLDNGTLTDFLDAEEIPWRHGRRITLNDALARVVEIHEEYRWIRRKNSLVIPVRVVAEEDGRVLLRFFGDLPWFRDHWQRDLPGLAGSCALEPEGNVLSVGEGVNGQDPDAVSAFCHAHLEPDPVFREDAYWYAIRCVHPELVFHRIAYYAIALFVLGSTARYQPELLLRNAQPHSELGWLLERFTRAAERFFPQILYSWLREQPVYF